MRSIKSEITKGVLWIGVAKYSGLFISLGISAILARNISPAAFGTMAVATVILAFLEIFVDMGIGPAIIQFKDLSKKEINSLFIIGLGIGIVLCLLLYIFSIPLANYYKDDQLIPVCRLLCICMLFNALNVVPNALMMKNKRFRTVAIRTLSFQILSGSVAIWGALHGWGIYALIITPLISSIGIFGVNYYNYPQSFFIKIEWKAVKRVFGYSTFQFLFSFVNYFSRNLDKLIIGKYFSMTQLGYYDKSYRLMQMPLQNITNVISPVLHPILSEIQNNKQELGEKNRKLSLVLSLISFPVGLLLYFCASEIIEILFGPIWKPAIPIFKILTISIPLQVILSTSGALYQSAGKTDYLFYVGVCNTIITVSGFIIAAAYYRTIESMAWAWNITLFFNFIISYVVLNKFTFKYALKKYFGSFIKQLINSAVVFVIMEMIIRAYNPLNLFVSLIIKSLLLVIITLIIGSLLHQYNIKLIIQKFIMIIRNRM